MQRLVVAFRSRHPAGIHEPTAVRPLAGEAAQQRAATHAADTFYSVKRLMGRSPGQVAHFSGQLAYGTAPSPCGSRLQLPCPALGRALDPEEVSAEVLRALVQRAQRHLDDDVTQAVITVPAHFTPQQRAATQRAAQLAGIQQASLLQGEPRRQCLPLLSCAKRMP